MCRANAGHILTIVPHWLHMGARIVKIQMLFKLSVQPCGRSRALEGNSARVRAFFFLQRTGWVRLRGSGAKMLWKHILHKGKAMLMSVLPAVSFA